jgi:hypothetical protein
MKPLLPALFTFVAVFLLAAVPAHAVAGVGRADELFAFHFGTAVVAAVTTAASVVARTRGWAGRIGLFVLTVATLPFVAGGSTGFAVGLLSTNSAAEVGSSVDLGLAGARMLYPMLFAASLAAWALAVTTLWATNQVAARVRA